MSGISASSDSQNDVKEPILSDEYLLPFTEQFRREIEQTMAFGWLIDESKLCQIALTSDGKYQGLVKWTKEYEDEERKSNRWSDEDVLSEKTADLHEAIYRKMLQIKRKYSRADSPLSDMSFCRVWIGGEDGRPKKHFCWTFTPFGPNSIQRAVVGDDAARAAALEQFFKDAGVDPSETADFWFSVKAYPNANVKVDRVDTDCEKILKPSLFLDPSCEPDSAGADEAEGSGTTTA